MCKKFVCSHNNLGVCVYDDDECDGICRMVGECSECVYNESCVERRGACITSVSEFIGNNFDNQGLME